MKTIAILGAGNIGKSLAEGILKTQTATRLFLTCKSEKTLKNLQSFSCNVTTSNKEAVAESDIVIIAVQPKQAEEVLRDISAKISEAHTILSIVSGVSTQTIKSLLENKTQKVFRAMPNTASKVGHSMTFLNKREEGLTEILETLGVVSVIDEKLFAEITVLAGSGTAIALKFIRAYMQAGIKAGVDEHTALKTAVQVMKGASILLEESGSHPEVEIDKVTTPAGCTISALVEMDHAGFNSSLLSAIEKATEQARMLYSHS